MCPRDAALSRLTANVSSLEHHMVAFLPPDSVLVSISHWYSSSFSSTGLPSSGGLSLWALRRRAFTCGKKCSFTWRSRCRDDSKLLISPLRKFWNSLCRSSVSRSIWPSSLRECVSLFSRTTWCILVSALSSFRDPWKSLTFLCATSVRVRQNLSCGQCALQVYPRDQEWTDKNCLADLLVPRVLHRKQFSAQGYGLVHPYSDWHHVLDEDV